MFTDLPYINDFKFRHSQFPNTPHTTSNSYCTLLQHADPFWWVYVYWCMRGSNNFSLDYRLWWVYYVNDQTHLISPSRESGHPDLPNTQQSFVYIKLSVTDILYIQKQLCAAAAAARPAERLPPKGRRLPHLFGEAYRSNRKGSIHDCTSYSEIVCLFHHHLVFKIDI